MMGTNSDSNLTDDQEKSLKVKRMAYFFIIAAATLWGTIGIYGKKLNALGFAPTQMVFIRAMGASVTLILFLFIKNKRLLKIKLQDSIYFVGTGILSFVFFNWCYFIAINRTSLSVATILLYTAPAFVMVFSAILFNEKMNRKKSMSLVLTFIGCVFVTVFGQGTEQKISMIGMLAGLGSGFGYALYSIFGRYALEKYDSITVTLYTFLFASLGLIPITDVKGMVGLFSNVSAIYYAVGLSILTTVLPFLLYTQALLYLQTSEASIIATLEPIVATVIGITLYGEPVTGFKIVGILIVISAISIMRERSGSDSRTRTISKSID